MVMPETHSIEIVENALRTATYEPRNLDATIGD
jgi:hypothetical protein